MSLNFDRTELAAAGRRAIDILVDNFDGPEKHRVSPECARAEMRQLMTGSISDNGVGLMQAVDDFADLVLPNSMRTPHPLYMGLINTSPMPAGPIGDLLISMLNNNGGAFHQGPALAAAEDEVVRKLGELFGLPHMKGLFLPGGSYANLHGLLLARQKYFPDWSTDGPVSIKQTPVLYTSDASHFSVMRSARVMGIGDSNVAAIRSIGRGEMDVDALATRIRNDRECGKRPFAVAATIGTTGTGAIDPIEAISDLCREQDLWLHVDACYGGGALLLDQPPNDVQGLERADSVVVDPHKWFYVPMTAAIAFTRHAGLEIEAFDVSASYIPGDGHVDPHRRAIPTSRRCSGAVTWFVLRAHGLQTIRESVRRNIRLARELERQVVDRGFLVLPDGQLSIACARWEPAGWSAQETDELQMRIASEIVQSGLAWFATVRHDDKTWLRFNLVNLHTRESHIIRLAESLHDSAKRLAESGVNLGD